jgi:hypothetical protein
MMRERRGEFINIYTQAIIYIHCFILSKTSIVMMYACEREKEKDKKIKLNEP